MDCARGPEATETASGIGPRPQRLVPVAWSLPLLQHPRVCEIPIPGAERARHALVEYASWLYS